MKTIKKPSEPLYFRTSANADTRQDSTMNSSSTFTSTSTTKTMKSVKFGHLAHEDIRTIIRQLQEFVDETIISSASLHSSYPLAYRQNFIPAGAQFASKVNSSSLPLIEHLENTLIHKLEHEPTDLHKYDVNLVGLLANRVTFSMGSDMVIKLAVNDFGRAENKHEQSVWTKASADLKTVLAPVKASSLDGGWLIMEASEPYPETGNYPEWLKGNAEDVQDLGYQSPYELNDAKLWGVLNSETVLVEYGFVPTKA
jgi:hypothetical protein